MEDLKKQAAELGIEVDGRWGEERIQQEIDKVLAAPKDPDGKPASNEAPSTERTTVKPAKKSSDMFPIRLLKNYVPMGDHEIVGHHRPAVVQKAANGQMVEISPAAFIEREMTPAPYPGAGGSGKVWANTIIRLPLDEAKRIVGKKIAERADALPG